MTLRALHCYLKIISVHTRVNVQIVPLDPSSLLCRDQQGVLWRCGREKIPSLFSSPIPCWSWASSLVGVGKHRLVASTFLPTHWLDCYPLYLSEENPGWCVKPQRILRNANVEPESGREMGNSFRVKYLTGYLCLRRQIRFYPCINL